MCWQTHVSIHARHYWRATHLMETLVEQGEVRFNPRPPLLAGDAPNLEVVPTPAEFALDARTPGNFSKAAQAAKQKK
jgi:hypothetical protein